MILDSLDGSIGIRVYFISHFLANGNRIESSDMAGRL